MLYVFIQGQKDCQNKEAGHCLVLKMGSLACTAVISQQQHHSSCPVSWWCPVPLHHHKVLNCAGNQGPKAPLDTYTKNV